MYKYYRIVLAFIRTCTAPYIGFRSAIWLHLHLVTLWGFFACYSALSFRTTYIKWLENPTFKFPLQPVSSYSYQKQVIFDIKVVKFLYLCQFRYFLFRNISFSVYHQCIAELFPGSLIFKSTAFYSMKLKVRLCRPIELCTFTQS